MCLWQRPARYRFVYFFLYPDRLDNCPDDLAVMLAVVCGKASPSPVLQPLLQDLTPADMECSRFRWNPFKAVTLIEIGASHFSPFYWRGGSVLRKTFRDHVITRNRIVDVAQEWIFNESLLVEEMRIKYSFIFQRSSSLLFIQLFQRRCTRCVQSR